MTLTPAYTYAATVTRWIDGDSVWLDVDLGFRMTSESDFRLYGINTPERAQPGYQAAKDRCNVLAPVGSTVTIQTYRNPDKYGRWLAEILSAGVDVNQTLITEGLAVAYFGGTK